MKLYTIGFAKTTAEEFFAKLRDNRVRVVLDTRLRRAGQLAGFAKMPDLQFFLRALYGIGYDVHPDLAPTEELLKRYRDKRVTWDDYALEYSMLLRERRPERGVSVSYFADACLLCLERSPEKCHRRLAAQYLRDAYDDDIEVSHL